MNRKVIQGQVSELLTLIGSLLFATMPSESLASAVGGIVALGAIIFAIYRHDGAESVFTLVRKALTMLPAIGVQFNWFDASVAAKLVGGIPVAFSLAWSWLSNGGYLKGEYPTNN